MAKQLIGLRKTTRLLADAAQSAQYAGNAQSNSLHTNAYDEAITTPTEESVRRAVAIQMIITKELGLNFCENPWQGSFIVDKLTDIVKEAVYKEFAALSERGGVLPLIGVTILPKEHGGGDCHDRRVDPQHPRRKGATDHKRSRLCTSGLGRERSNRPPIHRP